MRISDWSSDVCSSDLARGIVRIVHNHAVPLHIRDDDQISEGGWAGVGETWFQNRTDADAFLASSHVHAAEASHAQMMPEISHLLRSEEHTSELQSLMRISYAVFCLKKKIYHIVFSNNHKLEIENKKT